MPDLSKTVRAFAPVLLAMAASAASAEMATI